MQYQLAAVLGFSFARTDRFFLSNSPFCSLYHDQRSHPPLDCLVEEMTTSPRQNASTLTVPLLRRSSSFGRLRSFSFKRDPAPPLPSPSKASDSTTNASTFVGPPLWPVDRHYTRCYCEENAYLLAQQLLTYLVGQHGEAKTDRNGWKWDVWVVFVSNETKTVLMMHQKAAAKNKAVVWDYHAFVVVTKQIIPQAHPTGTEASPPLPREPLKGDDPAPLVKNGGLTHDSSTHALLKRPASLFRRRPSNKQRRQSDPCIDPWQGWVYDIDSRLSTSSGDDADLLKPVRFADYVDQSFLPLAASDSLGVSSYRPSFRVARAEAFLDNFSSDRSHMIDSSTGQWLAPPPIWPLIIGPRARRKGWDDNLMKRWVQMRPSDESRSQGSLAIQFGQVFNQADFSAGLWSNMAEWKRRSPPQVSFAGSQSYYANGLEDSVDSTMSRSEEQRGYVELPPTLLPRKGGRVMSPLFPAYMRAASESRLDLNLDAMQQA